MFLMFKPGPDLWANEGPAESDSGIEISTCTRSLLVLEYVGAPLSGQVAADLKGRWKTLARFGPNDGLTLLADEVLNSGHVVFEIDQDHYYRDPEIDLKALALACLVLEQLA